MLKKLVLGFCLSVLPLSSLAGVCDSGKADSNILLSIDVSGSMDSKELAVVMRGYREAFLDLRVRNNLLYCQCSQVAVQFWGDRSQIVYPLTKIQSEEQLNELVDLFDKFDEPGPGIFNLGLGPQTELYQSLQFSFDYVKGRLPEANETIVNIAGEGYDSRLYGNLESLRELNSKFYQAGITVNGLPIDVYRNMVGDSQWSDSNRMNNFIQQAPSQAPQDYPFVSDYYEKEVITQDGFMSRAENYNEFQRVLTEELMRQTCKLMM